MVFLSQVAFAGAWTQKKKGYFLKLSVNYLFTTKEFNHEGKKLDIFQERIIYEDTSFRDVNITAYFEYGLFENLTLVANLPFKILTSKRTEIIGGGLLARIVTIHTEGFSDLSISGRYRLLSKPVFLSFQGGFKIPLAYNAAPADDGAPLGTGKLDYEGQLLAGKSLYPLPLYFTAGIGYRKRTGAFHDQVFYATELGYTLGKVLFKATFDGLKSTVAPPDIVGQPVVTPLPGGGGALPNIIVGDQDIFKFSPSIIYHFSERFALQGEILHVFAGKNTVAGTTVSLGVILSK